VKILIVDDSTLLQTRLAVSLKKIDNEMIIYQAYNCKEAKDLFSSVKSDIVILDIHLPDGSGINLLQEFKKDKPAVNVIIFTNYSTDEFKKRCYDLHANNFIEKSDFSGLINTLTSLKTIHS